MITMKVNVDEAMLKALEVLPLQIQLKCIDPASKKMAKPIAELGKRLAPDSREPKPGQAYGPQFKWSASARARYNTGPSGQHVIHRYWKSDRGGILFIGMKSDGRGEGKKMHFRVPINRRQRRQMFWGRPAENYNRPSHVRLEEDWFLMRALRQAWGQSMMAFRSEFDKRVKEVKLG